MLTTVHGNVAGVPGGSEGHRQAGPSGISEHTHRDPIRERIRRAWRAPPDDQEGHTLATASATKTASKLQPLGDRVVIKPTPREEMTKSGIVLPDTAKEKPQEGLILAIGPGAFDTDGKRMAMDVKVGQKVLYGKYAGTEFKLEGEDLLIVSGKDILAVVEHQA